MNYCEVIRDNDDVIKKCASIAAKKCRDYQNIDDYVQEASLGAWNAAKSYDNQRDFKTFVVCCIWNKLLSYQKKKARSDVREARAKASWVYDPSSQEQCRIDCSSHLSLSVFDLQVMSLISDGVPQSKWRTSLAKSGIKVTPERLSLCLSQLPQKLTFDEANRILKKLKKRY